MNSSNTITRPSRETLEAMVAGDVVVPGDDGYDQARRAWDLAADQRPAVVVFAESVVDVVRAVRFAASRGMRIAPQGTGHGSLPLELLDGAMLLKTSRMRRVEFFPIERSSEVLHAWREWTGTVPDEVTSLGRILRLPPVPEIPEFLRGRSFVLVEAAYLGDALGR